MGLVAFIFALLGLLGLAAAALGMDSRAGWLGGCLVAVAVLLLTFPAAR